MDVKPSHFETLSKLIQVTELRLKVISQNVANINTPGYHKQDVTFEDQLNQQMSLLNESGEFDISGLEPEVVTPTNLPARLDGNNVDIEKEMGELNKNALLHNTYSQVLAMKLNTMKSAIRGE